MAGISSTPQNGKSKVGSVQLRKLILKIWSPQGWHLTVVTITISHACMHAQIHILFFFSPTLIHARKAAAGQISGGDKRGMGLNMGKGNQSTQLFWIYLPNEIDENSFPSNGLDIHWLYIQALLQTVTQLPTVRHTHLYFGNPAAEYRGSLKPIPHRLHGKVENYRRH